MRWLIVAACFWCGLYPAVAGPGTLQDFVDRYHCEVTARLQILYGKDKSTEPRDRFISINAKTHLDRYVQCLFEDDNSSVLCEVASGYFSAKAGQPRRFSLDQAGREKIKAFGFSDDDSKGNFRQIVGVKGEANLPVLARMMLSVLYEAYGVDLKSELDIRAPLATLGRARTAACSPRS
ncbi:MAG: hypothetical protein ABL901_13245 [Hyphomicrobiaceae bacterium]